MPQKWSVPVTATTTCVPMTITAPITSPTTSSASTDQRADGENSQRHALRSAPGGFAVATGYLDERTTAATALRSASLAATFLWSSAPPVLSIVTILLSAAASPLYFCATEAHDGPFLVVDAVWQLPHFSLAMMSSAGPANAMPVKAMVAVQAAIVEINFMLVSFGACCGLLVCNELGLSSRDRPASRRILRLGLIAVECVDKVDDVEIRRSVLVPYSAEAMFDLIEQAELYPSFLPWCTSAEILERSDDWVAARLEFTYLSLRFTMRTRNPKRRPEWLQVRMVEGPFQKFHVDWRLVPLADQGCRVAFDLSYQFSEGVVDQVAKVALGRIFGSVVEAFVKRAEATLPALIQAAPGASAASPGSAQD